MAGPVKREKSACAPVKRGVVLGALAAIVLLAAVVCLLHGENAVSLHGTVKAGECAAVESDAGRLADWQGETVELSRAEDERFLTYVRDVHAEGGVLYISGALMRLRQEVGEVRVRVGLIAEELGGGKGTAVSEDVLLLNTQMVREGALAEQYGCDDHCGFAAAVRKSALRTATEGGQYRIVLIDGEDDIPRLFETGCRVTIDEGGFAWAVVTAPEEEAQRDE